MGLGIAALCVSLLSAMDGPDRIDLIEDWRFKPAPERAGEDRDWASPELDDSDWARLRAGVRWEDQGFPDVDGPAWYRRRVDIPAAWEGRPVWLFLGALNDSGAVYCNGQLINTYGHEEDVCMAHVPLVAELSPVLRFGEPNLIAVKAKDWGGSGGFWRLPCAITSSVEALPIDSIVNVYMEPEGRRLCVGVHTAGLGNQRPDAALRVTLKRAGDAAASEWEEPLPAAAGSATIWREIEDAEPGADYELGVAVLDADGSAVAGIDWTREMTWPEQTKWEGACADLKVRNNFVTELLAVRLPGDGSSIHRFVNPRDGWVFIQAAAGSASPSVWLDDDAEPLVWRTNPETGAFEAMCTLPEGGHRLRAESTAPVPLEVRTVPELAYCYYPGEPHITPYGPYDWAYVTEHVLPHVNTLIARASLEEAEFAQWLNERRQWVGNATLPGLTAETPPTVDEVLAVWAHVPGATEPGYGGIIVDEFLTKGQDFYAVWGEALRQLHASPDFHGRTFYAWCGNIYNLAGSAGFRELVMDLNDRFSWEKYLHEEPSEEEALNMLVRDLRVPMLAWKEQSPGVEEHLVMCLGYLCAPPETLNRDPSIDYHVFMDMQFHFLATDPAFWNLYGVMEYMSSYADEESIRWAHKMFRHYCIEGKRTRLIDSPYVLPHLENPDFAQGLDGWQVEAADEGSVTTQVMDGYSHLHGRYPRTTQGDRFCRMTRSDKAPNRLRQTLRALEPGKAYSLKVISSDIGHLDLSQTVSVRVDIGGADILEEYGFEHTYPINYGHTLDPYTREHPAYFTFRRIVFRPHGETATLTISDWTGPGEPGGAIGQQTAFNFVEVQPFLKP